MIQIDAERERGRNYKLINELSPVSERTQRWTGDEWNGKGEIASGTLFLLFLTSLIFRKREREGKKREERKTWCITLQAGSLTHIPLFFPLHERDKE